MKHVRVCHCCFQFPANVNTFLVPVVPVSSVAHKDLLWSMTSYQLHPADACVDCAITLATNGEKIDTEKCAVEHICFLSLRLLPVPLLAFFHPLSVSSHHLSNLHHRHKTYHTSQNCFKLLMQRICRNEKVHEDGTKVAMETTSPSPLTNRLIQGSLETVGPETAKQK